LDAGHSPLIAVTWETLPIIVVTILVAILGVGRLTRVIVYDDFPPARWWRETWAIWCEEHNWSGWEKLFTCWWCFSFWCTLACVGWYIGGLFVVWLAWSWWIFWGSLAIAYVAAMVITRDDPNS
jgi:hypothetical protein